MSTRKPKNQPSSKSKRAEIAERPAERLQKVLAAAGIGSRRECEELIEAGRVEIDKKVVVELGTRVDPLRQEVRVDGVPMTQPKRYYFMVNKPPGVVSTNRDPDGRTRVIDLVRSEERLFPVGRLDRTSEGLILVTNDGELSNRLTHPRYGVSKTYRAEVLGRPTVPQLEQLRRGVHLADGIARVTSIDVKKRLKKSTVLEIVLQEGKNREIRRILARIGHKVLRLKRVAFGSLQLARLPLGEFRKLTRDEVLELEKTVRSASKRTQNNSAGSRSASPPKTVNKSVRRRRKHAGTGSASTTANGRPKGKTASRRGAAAVKTTTNSRRRGTRRP